jgi:multidrug resistance protein
LTNKNPAKGGLATVFFTVLIDLIGFGIVLPNLAFFASEYGASAFVVGLLYSSYSIAQLFFSPLWGALSDRIGRRPVMIVSTLGSALSYILLGFSGSIWALFAARLLAGIMAGNISTAQAYVSDVTTPENRARGMGLIGAAFGIGFVLGPAIGAILAHVPAPNAFFETHPHAMLGFFASALSFVSFFMVITVLPESLNRAARSDAARPVKMSVFSPAFWRLVSNREAGRGLPLLFFCMFMATFGQASIYGAFPLFCSQVLHLTPGQVGMEYVFVGAVAVVVQGMLIRPLVKKFGERPLFIAGNAIMTVGLALIAFAYSERSLFVFIGVMALGWSLNLPTLTSLISKRSDPRHYGATLGASQALSALGRALGPGWGGLLFGFHFQLPFVLTAALVSSTVFVALRFTDV